MNFTAKADLRKIIFKRLKEQPKSLLKMLSVEIVNQVKNNENFLKASHICLFTPTPSEVNIYDLFDFSFKKSNSISV
jgi:5-formyltetrahydrofolate cyclo-ligase